MESCHGHFGCDTYQAQRVGMTQRDLAEKLGVTPGRISQIIKGYPGMSLKLLARIESALDFRLDSGFRYEASVSGSSKSVSATMNPIYDKPRDDSHERRMGRRA